MSEIQTTYDRLKIFVENKYEGNMSKFSIATGISTATIDSYRRRNTILPPKHRDKIEEAGMSWQWYETGEGAMYSEAESRKGDNWEVHEAYEMVIHNINDLTVNEVMELYNRVKPIGEAFERV